MRTLTTRAIAAGTMLAAVLVGAPPALAGPTTTVSGTVTDRETGAPISGACLSLHRTVSLPYATVCTDAAGGYTFTGVPAGSTPLRLRVEADSYPDLWWPSAPDYRNAEPVPLDPNMPTQADLALTRSVGRVSGRVSYDNGAPAILATVRAVATTATWTATAAVDADGRYQLGNLPAGDYRLSVTPRESAPAQWVPGRTGPDDATVFTVATGGQLTVDERLLPEAPPPASEEIGALAGMVTSQTTGAAVPGACVAAYRSDWTEVARTCAGSDGHYQLSGLPTGSPYKVRATAAGFTELWATDRGDFTSAFWVSASYPASSVVDFALRPGPGGSIQGRLTDYPGGTMPFAVDVRALSVDGRWRGTTTVRNGAYRLDGVPPGDYRIQFAPGGRPAQYHPGVYLEAEARIVRVANGSTTTVDEQLLPPGVVEVQLVDAVTGAPVTSGCVWLTVETRRLCDQPSGVYRFDRAGAGSSTETVHLELGPGYWQLPPTSFTVRPGATTTTVTLRPQPAAVIKTTVVDAKDPSVHPSTCVQPVGAGQLVYHELPHPERPTPYRYCSDNQGNLVLGPLPPGKVQLLALPQIPYGAQWVGPTGGTGDRRTAATIELSAWQVTTIPPIRLDLAGSVSGTVRVPAGRPGVDYCVRAYGGHPDLINVPLGRCAKAGQGFTVSGLGPYDWPLYYSGRVVISEPAVAGVWSGGAANRFEAVPVRVRAGTDTTVPEIAFAAESKIGGFQTGGAADYQVVAYDGVTGDEVARADGADANSARHNLTGLHAGPVVLRYVNPPTGRECWYVAPGATPAPGRRPLPTPVVLAAGEFRYGLSLVPGQNCLEMPVEVRLPRLPTGPKAPAARFPPVRLPVLR